jgi:hypothetical protein
MSVLSSAFARGRGLLVLSFCTAVTGVPVAQSSPSAAAPVRSSVERRLAGLDAYMEKVLEDWNAPGVVAGIVVKDTRRLAE